MSNYDVLVQPDDRYWYVQVPAIERSTQAKGLDDIEPMAKDLITVMNDDDNPELKVTFVLPKQAKQHVTEMFRQREIAKKANAQAAAESRLAAQALRNEGLTYRQIGALLGVSYQRAFQLVNGKTKHKTTASESPQPTTESRSPRTNHATPLSTPVSGPQSPDCFHPQAQEHRAESSHPSRLRRSSLVRVAMEAGASVRALAPVPASSASKEASVNWRASSLLVC